MLAAGARHSVFARSNFGTVDRNFSNARHNSVKEQR